MTRVSAIITTSGRRFNSDMKNAPVLDHKYLTRTGFIEQPDGEFARSVGAVEVRVADSGQGVLIDRMALTQIPVKVMSVTHLKWFMDAFK